MRVAGSLARRDDLWDQCYRDLMARVHLRLDQEVHRLGGDYAHVLDETIGSRRDDRIGEGWLRGCIKYVLHECRAFYGLDPKRSRPLTI